MQLYAPSIADPVRSAMIMGVFALGTTPGLLGIGGLTAIVKGTFAQAFFRFAGVLVIVLSLVNFQSALTLFRFFPTTSPRHAIGCAKLYTPNISKQRVQYLIS